MDELIQTRYRLKAKLARIEKFTGSYDHTVGKVQDIEVRLALLSEICSEFDKTQSEIERTCKKTNLKTEELEQEEFEDRALAVRANLLSLNEQSAGNSRNTQVRTTSNPCSPSSIKLPLIELPVFYGDYLQWPSFIDLFSSLIDNNSALNPVQKLHYLKSSLRGDAARLLNSITTTNANYSEALNILCDRYANKKQIIFSHLRSLFSQPKLNSESVFELRKLLDVTVENVRGLHVLGLPTDQWDCILVFLASERVDHDTRRQWELVTSNNDSPTFAQFKEFLETRCRSLEAAGLSKTKSTVTRGTMKQHKQSSPSTNTTAHHAVSANCEKCKGDHILPKCEEFLRLPGKERSEFIKTNSLCFNCLKSGHYKGNCKSSLCRKCHKPHHTVLHYETTVATHALSEDVGLPQVLLATASVKLLDSMGQKQICRALLDSGSQASFISEACVQRLNLKRRRASVGVNGLALSVAGVARGIVQLQLSSVNTTFSCKMQALILPRVTGQLPFNQIDTTSWTHINNLKLADPNFHVPSNIDLLLGADVCPELMQVGKIVGPIGSPVAQNTSLGWIVSGRITTSAHLNIASPNNLHMMLDISEQLKQFWELEEIPQQRHLTTAERDCEAHFEATHTRDNSGRYMVRLPFKDNSCLGSSKSIAIKRLMQVERRLACQPGMRQQYVEFMTEYLNLGHMEPIANENRESPHAYYLPHHAVIKEHSSTTKLRVVFDGTAKPFSGSSINDTLLVGPTIQDDLVSILLRFRMFNIAFTADINKMYRQILVHPDDRDYQRIVWRATPNESIQEFRLTTVTYGTSAAPYLATKCLQQLAYDGQNESPMGSATLNSDFYVDDLMSGADSMADALQIQTQLIKLLHSGGFELRKWSSNEPKLLEALPSDLREDLLPHQLNYDGMVKTLGLYWHPTDDCFSFRVSITNSQLNKRTILSEISRLFDPLGWLAPLVLCAKLIIQKLWLLGVSWDESLPSDVEKRWNMFRGELPMIESIRVARRAVHDSNCKQYQLHGFSDASERAYGTVVFLRSIGRSNEVCVNIICAKSKVAPIKQISLPRLELCGAVLMARLVKKVQEVLTIADDSVFLWTDSMVVLSWLSSHASRWKTFVANRVSEIQGLIPRQHWSHVKSADNPADCLSRGLNPSQLVDFPLWWHGPIWLCQDQDKWPRASDVQINTPEERKNDVTMFAATVSDTSLLSRYSSLSRLIRVSAYCRRFIHNCRSSGDHRLAGHLSVDELKQALHVLIKQTQSISFSGEIRSCLNKQPLPTNSRLLSLHPFIDADGVLRVGGRLQEANISYSQKHPIILPNHHPLTDLIITYEHLAHLHAGPQLLLTVLRQKYWIVCARQAVRHQVHKCIKCFRLRAQTSQQLMAGLPSSRLQPGRPFIRCGVDYAGPITLRLAKGRGGVKTHKAYICVFVCFIVKAIHLELVNDLSTESFIAALHRFISRRGKPADIFSDCGTNFVGANRELLEMHKLTNSTGHNHAVADALSAKGITWHFNPPAAPHFGGLWEAGVKSVKYHLYRVVGGTILTYEEMYTVLTQIEACLNSRPLCPITSDPGDLSALTPGHFLIGDALTTFPEMDLVDVKMNRLSRWCLVQRSVQHFWKAWSSEFLARLQQRPKWTSLVKNINVGDLVILKEENLSPLKWPLARVIEIHPGKDNVVRVVTVRTVTGVLKRPVVKCCLLPNEQ